MLKEYEQKRDFSRTGEPPVQSPSGGEGPPAFVMQKHAARRLHYDLRLEFKGVLKSWAVPKGPSLDPEVKRLAVMVEDHPLEYGSFEGVIPEGAYGAGEVIVWDHGDYSPDNDHRLSFGNRAEAEERMGRSLEEGKVSFTLRGTRLKGSWTLIRMKRGQNEWLLIKHRDDAADPVRDILGENSSVLSGLTVEDLRAGRMVSSRVPTAARVADMPGVVKAPLPDRVRPMLAARSDSIFSDPDWLFEPKLDGYRIFTHLNDGTLRLLSRNGIDVTARYATIHAPLSRQPASQLLLDGEIVALDALGRPCFQCLQDYQELAAVAKGRGGDGTAIIYYIFDILYLDGYDLHAVPLIQRKGILGRVLQPSGAVRSIAYFEGGGEVVYRSAIDQGFEGVIAKRRESVYEAGRRSSSWLKIKSTVTEEFIVGGYTLGSGNRARTFGALVLGYFDDERKRLIAVGSVGTGFDENTLNGIKKRLDAIEAEECPFAVVPELDTPATWVRPELVVEIQFSEWTHDQQLRTPVYLRLREDKPADQIGRIQVFAKPVGAPSQGPALSPRGDMVADLVERLKNGRDILSIEIEGHTLSLSNLSKALWPPSDDRPAFTKRDLLTYLLRVSPYLLKHLRDRPLTLSRYPDGIGGEQFYQKHWHTPLPQFVETVALSERHQRGQRYLLCNNLPTLLWLGQAAVLELHTWFSSVSPAVEGEAAGDASAADAADRMTHYPDFVVFDLDPYIYAGSEPPGAEPQLNRAAFDATCEAALWLKETLDALGLRSFVKSSGRTGLHIYVPLRRQFDYRAVHSAAKTICQFVLQRHPRELTVDWPVERRTGRVFLDYNQNVRGKTLASIYSPRAAPEATVSTPLLWEELRRVYPTDFTIQNLPARLARIGDLWADISSSRSDLKEVLGHQ